MYIWSFKPKTYDTFRTAPYPPLQPVARYAFSDGAPGGGSLDGCDAGSGAGDAQKGPLSFSAGSGAGGEVLYLMILIEGFS